MVPNSCLVGQSLAYPSFSSHNGSPQEEHAGKRSDESHRSGPQKNGKSRAKASIRAYYAAPDKAVVTPHYALAFTGADEFPPHFDAKAERILLSRALQSQFVLSRRIPGNVKAKGSKGLALDYRT